MLGEAQQLGVARVGLLLPLSGRHAVAGQALLNAAQLALFDIAGEHFSLLVRDTGGTPDGARAAAVSVLQQGAELIIGPLFAASAEAVAPVARSAGVNVLTFSNDRAAAGGGVFIMGVAPSLQVERVIDYAARQGLRRYAALAPRTPYGEAVVRALQAAVTRRGLEVSQIVFYQPGADATAEVRDLANYNARRAALLAQRKALEGRDDEASKRALARFKGADTLGLPDFQAILLPEGGKRLLALAPLLPYYDIDPDEVQYLGTSLWDDPALGTEPALTGGWFAAPPPQAWANFHGRYKATFGEEPPRIASLAYDATALAAVLTLRAAAAGRTVDFSVAAITETRGFAGVDGIFRLLASGEIDRGLAVLEMRRDAFSVLEAAPSSFQDAVN